MPQMRNAHRPTQRTAQGSSAGTQNTQRQQRHGDIKQRLRGSSTKLRPRANQYVSNTKARRGRGTTLLTGLDAGPMTDCTGVQSWAPCPQPWASHAPPLHETHATRLAIMVRKEPGSCDCDQQIDPDHRHHKIGHTSTTWLEIMLSRLQYVSAAGDAFLLKLVLKASSHQTNATC